jgi:hypothetical protein
MFSNNKISTQTKQILETFLSDFNLNNAKGIPRGIEISPVMSELSLMNFDKEISTLDHVFYYSRFVDDIFIITSSREEPKSFLKLIRRCLPEGLSLNHNKKTIIDVPRRSIGNDLSPPENIVASVDYLGYKICVIDYALNPLRPGNPSPLKTSEYRDVRVDITRKKIDKIKAKISKAFYAHAKKPDFELLKDRIIFLSTNRDLINKVNRRKIPTGVYYSHSDADQPCLSLIEIDKFLKVLIHSPQGRMGNKLGGVLTKSQKVKLLKISLFNGFNKRIFKRFCPNRLGVIARIWS